MSEKAEHAEACFLEVAMEMAIIHCRPRRWFARLVFTAFF